MGERVIYHELAAVHHHHHPHPHQHHQQQSPHSQALFHHPQPQQRRPKQGMAAMPALASPSHVYANANGAAAWRGARQQQYYPNTISTGHGPGPTGAAAMKQLQAKQLANSEQQQQQPPVASEVSVGATDTLPTTPRSGQIKPPRNKSEEAIADLLVRIPDVGQLFDVHSRIGNGTFSTVLLATMRREANLPESLRRKFAIKHHIPTSHPDRIMKELQCMTKMGGTENVVGIHCCLRCDASAAFVMPYMPHDRFHDFYTRMDVPEIRLYMRNLLVALRHVHKFDVIHRDVKPSNFLYNRRRREFLLVDFGLAQHANPPVMGAIANPGVNYNNNNNSKRPRERETEAVQANVQADAGLGGAVKRMRLHEEGTKMPLKPVNEIAQGEAQPADGSNPSQQPTTMLQQQPQQPQQVPQQDQSTASTPASGSKYNTNRSASGASANSSKCFCFANPSVCLNCLMKKEVHASRAGTPGYRPPEVLLKYPDQTTAVDVWAAGVIFLSIMSSVYPFFKAPNDFIALAEIVTIFGDQAIRKTALALDRMITLSQRSRPLNLRKLCLRFRHRTVFSDAKLLKSHESADGRCEVCRNCDQYFFNCLCDDSEYVTEPLDAYECFPASAYDLLHRLLEVNPHKRITAAEALQHPFFTEAAEEVAEQPRKVRRQRHHKQMVTSEQQQADLELQQQTAINNKLLN